MNKEKFLAWLKRWMQELNDFGFKSEKYTLEVIINRVRSRDFDD